MIGACLRVLGWLRTNACVSACRYASLIVAVFVTFRVGVGVEAYDRVGSRRASRACVVLRVREGVRSVLLCDIIVDLGAFLERRRQAVSSRSCGEGYGFDRQTSGRAYRVV